MRIEFDYDFSGGRVVATHYIETEPGKHEKIVHPNSDGKYVDVVDLIKHLHNGALDITGTGWEVISKHPRYQGVTRLQVLIAEMKRLDDNAALAYIGA